MPEMLLSQAEISLGVIARRRLRESRDIGRVNYDYLALNSLGETTNSIICQNMAYF
jgi:hypothetical protein